MGESEPITRSSPKWKVSRAQSMKSKKLLWFSTTPFGVPVDPDVLMIHEGSLSMIVDRRLLMAVPSTSAVSSASSSRMTFVVKGMIPSIGLIWRVVEMMAAGSTNWMIFLMRSAGVLMSRFM